ncbi:MAG: hypothetical protein ACKVHU_09100 [Acidimicrobiales bacterium]
MPRTELLEAGLRLINGKGPAHPLCTNHDGRGRRTGCRQRGHCLAAWPARAHFDSAVLVDFFETRSVSATDNFFTEFVRVTVPPSDNHLAEKAARTCVAIMSSHDDEFRRAVVSPVTEEAMLRKSRDTVGADSSPFRVVTMLVCVDKGVAQPTNALLQTIEGLVASVSAGASLAQRLGDTDELVNEDSIAGSIGRLFDVLTDPRVDIRPTSGVADCSKRCV